MIKPFKYEIYPTKNQQKILDQNLGCCRWVYNWALELKSETYKRDKTNLSRFDLGKLLTQLKKYPEYKWLNEAAAQSLQNSLKNLDAAFTSFFKKKSKYPKFKSKYRSEQSCQYPQYTEMNFETWRVKILKLGWIKVAKNEEHIFLNSKIKTCTVTKTPTHRYFISILVDLPQDLPQKLPIQENKTIGIDLGLKDFAILSTGEKIENPKLYRKYEKKLKVDQRRLSRKQKGSKNYQEQRLKVAKDHEKIKNSRTDFLQKLSSKVVYENQDITSFCIEDLAVKNMIKNRKVSKSIGDAGWGLFVRMLEYKCDWSGKNLIKIGRLDPSSKMCSCGVKCQDLSLDERTWTCSSCKVTHDRDILAANNIKKFGLAKAGRSGQVSLDKQSLPERSGECIHSKYEETSPGVKKEESL